MENKIYNILYKTTVIAYPLATVSDVNEKCAGKRLEKHLIEHDSMKGAHLGFKIVKIVDTGIKTDLPAVLNSDRIHDRNGEID